MKSKIPTTRKLLKYLIHHPGSTAKNIAHDLYNGDLEIAMKSLKNAEMYLLKKDGSANQFRDLNEFKFGPILHFVNPTGASYYYELIHTDLKFYLTLFISILALAISIANAVIDYKSLP